MEPNEPRRIIVLEPDALVSATLVHALRGGGRGWEVIEASSAPQALNWIASAEIDVFLCAHELRFESGTEILAQAHSIAPETVGMLTVSSMDPQVLLDAINLAGAYRCLVKPFPEARLLAEVGEALLEHRRRSALASLLRTVHAA